MTAQNSYEKQLLLRGDGSERRALAMHIYLLCKLNNISHEFHKPFKRLIFPPFLSPLARALVAIAPDVIVHRVGSFIYTHALA